MVSSLAGNLIRTPISFVTSLLLARWMGPSEYGRMVFLLASFGAVRGLLDLGTGTAFFTFLSQHKRGRRFIAWYWLWVLLQFGGALAFLVFVLPEEIVAALWVGEGKPLLALALAASFVQGTVWTSASQMAEADRETRRLQRLQTIVVLVHLGTMTTLFVAGELAVPVVFLAMIVEWFAGGVVAAQMYDRADTSDQAPEHLGAVLREFAVFCWPLIPYAVLTFVYSFVDRWMLQTWGGASEQGYFGVAQQLSGVALIAASSVLRVFWKEVAEAEHVGDRARIISLYRRLSRLLFFVGAAVAAGLVPWTRDVIELSVGRAYSGGVEAAVLMFLYPVHQSIGQLNGTFMYATGMVRLQVSLGSISMVGSIIVAYFLMAPPTFGVPGLGLASLGLAWKMVGIQFITVNVGMWVIARRTGGRFDGVHQARVLGICLGIGVTGKWVVTEMIGPGGYALYRLAAGLVVYGMAVAVLVFVRPGLAGLTEADLRGLVSRLR